MPSTPSRTHSTTLPTLTRRPSRPWHPATLAIAAGLCTVLSLGLAGCGSRPPAPQVETRPYVDRVLVKKSERKMQLLSRGKVVREYRVALGDAPRGHKMQEGDERTPVGDYILDWRNPRSSFHKALHVSYPNERDQALAKLLGLNPGGMIMVHGLPNHVVSPKIRAEYRYRDWTNGCIAVENHEMDEIWSMVRDGTPIRIQE